MMSAPPPMQPDVPGQAFYSTAATTEGDPSLGNMVVGVAPGSLEAYVQTHEEPYLDGDGEYSSRVEEDDEQGLEDGTNGGGEYSGEEGLSGEEGTGSEFSGPVKLFVGQVPKTMEEEDLSPFFSKYGPVEDVAIIRDKHTGQHRGCAFVTFLTKESAEACEEELHNQFVFADGRRPVQIRPAGRKEAEVENKLFVGMLPRNVQEHTVRDLFQPFGEITGVYMIRSNDGIKKGCAFVKYAQRESAVAAIESMNGKLCVEGSERPLIVKFADTRSQKRARQHQQQARRDGAFNPSTGGSISHESHGSAAGSPYYMNPGPPLPVHIYPGHGTPPPMGISAPHNAAAAAQYSSQAQYPTAYPATHGAGTPPPPPPNFMYQQVNPYAMSPSASPYPGQGGHVNVPRQRHARSHRPPQHRYGAQQGMHEVVNPRPREGPAGANLFIYHLPHDLTDADLATAFNPFGNVISAKVYVDRYTGESKGFGFVSYDSVISAEHAIEQMNGFQIGSKRLKVQHKRVNHRPPMVQGMQSYYPPGAVAPSVPVQDVPPSIEILSEGDDTATGAPSSSSQSTSQHDVEVLNRNFSALRTDGRSDPGEYQD